MVHMNISGLDYNTGREKLELPEYGREVRRMVEHALTITDRQERQRCAKTIVAVMRRVSPQATSSAQTARKYWDHLAYMSGFKLDIDYPFDIEEAHKITQKPTPLAYTKQEIPVRHYGMLLFNMFDKLKKMPACEERDRLVGLVANQMKRCLLQYSHGDCSEEKVADDLARYTDGVIQLDLNTFRFSNTTTGKSHTEKKKRRR